MKALPHPSNRAALKRGAALAMLCAALGYSCALACGVYPPERYSALLAAPLASAAAYVAFRAVAHRGAPPDFNVLLQHCSIALAIVLLPMLFAANSMPAWAQLATNATMLACAGIAALGVLSQRHSSARAVVIMAACALGWVVGTRGLAYAGLGSMSLHATTATAIALLAASAPLFTRDAAGKHAQEKASDARKDASSENAADQGFPEKPAQLPTETDGNANQPTGPTAMVDKSPQATKAHEMPRPTPRSSNPSNLENGDRESTLSHKQALPLSTQESPVEALVRTYELSKREGDLVALIVQGADNKRISETLFISPNTVKTHLRNIYGKLGVHSKEEIIALARKPGE